MEQRHLHAVSTLRLNAAACTGCGMCVTVCPHAVFTVSGRKAAIVDHDACMECGACARNCAAGALTVRAGVGCATAILRARNAEPGCGPGCDCACE